MKSRHLGQTDHVIHGSNGCNLLKAAILTVQLQCLGQFNRQSLLFLPIHMSWIANLGLDSALAPQKLPVSPASSTRAAGESPRFAGILTIVAIARKSKEVSCQTSPHPSLYSILQTRNSAASSAVLGSLQ
jgi:hypothetical protein